MAAAVPYARERLIAELAVQRASLLTKRVSQTFAANSELSKSDASPVTIADFAAQALLISAIHAAFPADTFVGEEDSAELRRDPQLAQQVWELVSHSHSHHLEDAWSDGDNDALLSRPATIEEMFDVIDLGGHGLGGRTGRFWALDPIDGTAAFIKGQQYAVSLALIEDGREVVGVVGCPNLLYADAAAAAAGAKVEETSVDADGLGAMLSAVRGQGAVVRPMRRRGGLVPLEQAQVINKLLGGGHDVPAVELKDVHLIDSKVTTKGRQLADEVGVAYPGTQLYSSHMRYVALILGGRGHVQVRFPKAGQTSYIWDHAGAQLIYTETGMGKVTDLYGEEIDFGRGRQLDGNWGVIAADESVHGKILDLVRKLDVGG
ncbi:inositol monophosphatase family protein [Bombardia bombarda]|uniref:Inositol monophosphatase family protein n=1 Tax=Bombardia bombarda TaxID=252184 RepID=A0AA39XAS7_9PEZI|nr:inositol monophosphatase family protein [Bombardia bombarda]